MKKLLAIPVVALVLAACEIGGGGGNAVLAACEAWTAGIRVVTVSITAGEMSDADIATVERLAPIVNGVCLGERPVAGVPDLSVVHQAILQLAIIQGGL